MSAMTATAWRVTRQLRRDPRTVALVFVVPAGLLALLDYVFSQQPGTMDRVGPPLVGLFPLVLMFLLTSIAMLRERTTGTLERLMSMPVTRLSLLAGYGIAFAVIAAAQASFTGVVAFALLGWHTEGPVVGVIALAVANAVLGMALGLFMSAFATSEFQAVQFMPAFVLPQLLVVGLFVPRQRLPGPLEAVSDFLPLTYAYEALVKVAGGDVDARLWVDVAVVAACIVGALVAGAATLRRRTP